MKLLKWIGDNILFIFVMFLLFFIPLFPKRPLLDVVNTWVYIRGEDFVVLLAGIVWVSMLFMRKVTLRTPLTVPILIFWLIGGIATIHGVLVIFPHVADVYPNLALFSYLRHIEYLLLFFIAFASIKSQSSLKYIIIMLVITFYGVLAYGIGQRYLGFPAFLTMNEEFAKGIGIQLSTLSRVPSTFGGHYDLAAYLVLIIPILMSLVIGVRNIFLKGLLLVSGLFGFWLMFMTVSRVSIFALMFGLFAVLFFYRKKIAMLAIPFIALLSILVISFSPALVDRFGSTIMEVDVLIDEQSGHVVGHPVFVTPDYFDGKVIVHQFTAKPVATTSGEIDPKLILKNENLPESIMLLTDKNKSTGEDLPAGTGYINLSLSPNIRRQAEYYLEDELLSKKNYDLAQVFVVHGDYLLKRALAYDLSFTTRFQGGWPNAIDAFERNIFLGSGYSAAGLAVDNNFLRILAETGILGLLSFLIVLIAAGAYIKSTLPHVTSPLLKSFVIGFSGGLVGLFANAFLIDVFEASKVAFYLWLLLGIVIGLLSLSVSRSIPVLNLIKKVSTSTYAIVVYLLVLVYVLYMPMASNYFTGDDFTWFRWIADCNNRICGSFFHYLTDSEGFFYRPGTKMYFYLMYRLFWLNQAAYHMVSIGLHFISTVLVFFLAKKVFKNRLLATVSGILFLMMSGFSEAIFWISSTGFLFNAVSALAGMLFYIQWKEKKNGWYLALALISAGFGMLFHELGIVTPLLFLLYDVVFDTPRMSIRKLVRLEYVYLMLPVVLYLGIRLYAGSFWFAGDYSYDLAMLPFNIAGNLMSYLAIMLAGPMSLPVVQVLRILLRENIAVSLILLLTGLAGLFYLFKYTRSHIAVKEQKILLFGGLFSIISLLPFIGLGGATSRYSYLATVGFIILLVYIVQKLYESLTREGIVIARLSIVVVFCIFSLFHIIQINKIQQDWDTAGSIVTNFFRSIDLEFKNYWRDSEMELHFSNVPIRHGEAWVFPVGLEDGLWFKLYNPDITIYQASSDEEALRAVSLINIYEQAYSFKSNGELINLKLSPEDLQK